MDVENITANSTNREQAKRLRRLRLKNELSQRDLAAAVGISSSYLNLIESGRRSLTPVLIKTFAQALCVSTSELSVEGIKRDAAELEAALDQLLGPVAEKPHLFGAEHLPALRQILETQNRQAAQIAILRDRLTEDRTLSDLLHDVLSTTTAIQATATILNDGDPIDPAWITRFHRNIADESQRLAVGLRELTQHLSTT